ncbi:methylenetetrahydrofolate reductase [Candidatus Hodgkinia cicadicola]
MSVELFPPKHYHKLANSLRGVLVAEAVSHLAFASLTCGARGTEKHNSFKAMPALASLFGASAVVVHVIQIDKALESLAAFACFLARSGASNFLLLKGDRYFSNQLRSDSSPLPDELKLIKCSFVVTTGYCETHGSATSYRTEIASALAKESFGCVLCFTQFFNSDGSFLRASASLRFVASLWCVSGFVVSPKRSLGCRISVKCGVYVSRLAKRLVLVKPKLCSVKRIILANSVAKLHASLANGMRWVHVFELNRFRSLSKAIWVLAMADLVYQPSGVD